MNVYDKLKDEVFLHVMMNIYDKLKDEVFLHVMNVYDELKDEVFLHVMNVYDKLKDEVLINPFLSYLKYIWLTLVKLKWSFECQMFRCILTLCCDLFFYSRPSI